MFKQVDAQPDYVKQEEETLKWWDEQGVVEKYLHKNDASEKKYAFLDGPITANNPMGVHHAHGRTIKDFFQRYKNMQGYKQRFQNGFDCQGLWVEVEEEKDLGFNSKRDIEAYGIDKFCLSCRARVERFSKVQADQSKRLGMFMDWDNSYYTMSENNNLHIWHFLKVIHERGWVYKGVDAMPWCTRCGTAISQHELSDGGYKDVTHESVYVKYPMTSDSVTRLRETFNMDAFDSASLLIWTTTPWTLLANVAVAVNPDLQYALVKVGSELVVVAKDRLNVMDEYDEVVKEVTGKQLVEALNSTEMNVYTGPFDELDAPSKVNHRLVLWTDVTAEDGTGLVHIAPGAGKEDFELRKENGLDLLEPIDEFGDYVDGYGEFSKRNVFDVRADIYASLKQKGIFYKTASIFHSYPHCWRCKHELVFRTTSEWFISADEIRPHMKKAAETANWMPAHAGKRMQDWLDNMGDWPISRKRYWGLALPFYENEDKTRFYVVGSKDELRELAVDPAKVDALPELHRPWIDEVELDGTKIEIDGDKQSGIWKRVKDVGDCWLDAGIVPFSTVDYLNNPEYWKDWYPFEFITEYVAQVKLWFYATLFMSVALEDKAPWQNVLATGFLVDEKGKAMHKSAGNAIAFDEAADKVGADALRWLYLRERTANHYGTGDLRFGYTILHDVQRRFMNILWNTYRYFVTHATAQGWEPEEMGKWKMENGNVHILDRWVVSRLYSVLQTVNTSLDRFDSPTATTALESFIVNDFSQWYVRRSRERLNTSDENTEDSEAFFATTYQVLNMLTRVLAPFIPYLAEEMFQNLRLPTDPLSVHLADWPHMENMTDAALEEQMVLVRQIVEQGHSVRKQEGVRLRQPLQSVTVSTDTELPADLQDIVASELNVKEVHLEKQDGELKVELDLSITEVLQAEGAVREVLREIQNLRKNAGLAFDKKAVTHISVQDNTLESAIKGALEELETKTICKVEFVDTLTNDEANTSTIETPLGVVVLHVTQA